MKNFGLIVFLSIFSLGAMEPTKGTAAEQLQSLITKQLPAEIQLIILEKIWKSPFPKQNIANFLKNYLNVITSLDPAFFPQEVKKQYLNVFAKQWYLNYDKWLKIPESWTKRHFSGKTPEQILDYGFSISELQREGKLPKIKSPYWRVFVLDLSGMRINNLIGLKQIPDIKKVTDLQLYLNQLKEIPGDAFTGLDQLKILSLRINKFDTIPTNAFASLNNLEKLDLAANQISTIPTKAFAGLDNLKRLDIGINPISTISTNAFVGLNNLIVLILASNQISTISAEALAGLDHLRILNLTDNPIKFISPHALAHLKHLGMVILFDVYFTDENYKTLKKAFPNIILNGLRIKD